MGGWIKLQKSISEHWLWEDPVIFKAWIDLLISVNYTDKKILFDGNLVTVKAGQLITSIRKLATRWKCSKERVNKILGLFQKDGMILIDKTTRRTLLTVVNYSVYQNYGDSNKDTDKDTEKDSNKDTDSPQHKNITNNKEYKKESEEPELPPVKKSRFPVGKYQNVFLSNDEAAKLNQEFGLVDSQRVIEKLSEYMQTSGKKYADHYAVIAKWIREDRANPKPAPKPNKVNDYNQRNYTNEDITDMERKKLSWMYED